MDTEFLQRLKGDFPEFRFIEGTKFTFRPPKTIVLGPSEPFSELLALHEVSHAILKHKTFRMDVERLRMESEAWEKARGLALKYDIEVNEKNRKENKEVVINLIIEKLLEVTGD